MSALSLIGMTIAVVAVALIAGLPALFGRAFSGKSPAAAFGEATAAGVFLGAGLIHMLADAAGDYDGAGVDYPWPFLLAGSVVLALLLLEQIGAASAGHADGHPHKDGDEHHGPIVWIATAMLSVHSFLAGAALGTSGTGAVAIVIFLAILAHKWAASFALALTLRRSALAHGLRLVCFAIFVVSLPAGVVAGAAAADAAPHMPLLAPTLKALAGGTFIYLGTLHGLAHGALVSRWEGPRSFVAVAAGFALMAIVAIWT